MTEHSLNRALSLTASRARRLFGAAGFLGFGLLLGLVLGFDLGRSLGGCFSQAANDAVTASIADGVVYSVAAGNGDELGNAEDACTVSPASRPRSSRT
mgnify:CR=1 FL=1